jgi:expansin (peptidoglycan-binding protein)
MSLDATRRAQGPAMRKVAALFVANAIWACGAEPPDGSDAATGTDATAPADANVPPDAAPAKDAGAEAAPIDAGADAITDAAVSCTTQPLHEGGLTQYDQTSANNCGVPWPTSGMYAAISTPDYDSPTPSGTCGKCLEVTGPTGLKATFLAVDQCPTSSNPKCVKGHLDLSHTAFAAVVPTNYKYGGEVPNQFPISWTYVACSTSGNIVYHFDNGTSQYWVAVQIRNARYGIAKIRFRPSGTSTFTDMTDRTDGYAYFTANLSKTTTLDFQAIDEYGHVLEDDNVSIAANTDHTGGSQFPLCP